MVDDLLAARGVDLAQKDIFLNPDFERDGHDPMLLPDMVAAVERIVRAMRTGEKVAVWSDYDADGLPAGVMLSQFLREMGLPVVHYVPDRHLEGFGLNKEGIDELAAQGVKLMITADCGTTDTEPIAHALALGINTIVTDHHVPPERLPEALVINPHRADSRYPFAQLCGAGVAWKLVQGILQSHRPVGYAAGKEKWLLDLVGIGTLSDMVPLLGENRMLAHFGLTVMRRARRPGLSALFDLLKIKPASLTEDDVGFMISPRINAASRMGSPLTAAKLLGAQSSEAHALARELQALNDTRKGAVAAAVKEATHRLHEMTPSPVIVMGSPHWRPGILGLVASNLAEAHGKPVFLWGREGGADLKGSCRSDGQVSVVECMRAASDALLEFGGHHGAGGFSVSEERVHELPGKFKEAYESLKLEAAERGARKLDRELAMSEVAHAHSLLRTLAPFGVGFEKPLFIVPRVAVASVRAFGKQRNHLGVTLEQDGERLEGVSFFSTPDSFDKKVSAGARADVVGHVEADWQGKARLRVVDFI